MSATLARAISFLRDAYPNTPFGDRSCVVYAEQLADLDHDDVEAAIRRLVNTTKYLPRISEIRREVIEQDLGLPSVDEAWDMALEHSLAAESVRRAWALPDPVRGAIKSIGGGWAIRHSTNPDTLRAQFRKTYENRRENAIREAAVGPPIRPEQLKPGYAPQIPPAGKTAAEIVEQYAAASGKTVEEATEAVARAVGDTPISLAARRLANVPVSTSIRPKG